ncbi:MAG TPA: hypothetical protein VKT28_04950 [Puia sp.]|nr:hypothetical protein [Puia sp.]
MKKIIFIICLLFISAFYILSCKKQPAPTPTPDNNDVTQKVAAALQGVDSLSQFASLIKTITLTNTQTANGVTVLAIDNNSLINPISPDDLKDYIIQGIISPSDLTNGKVLTSITGKQITITVQNGNTYANGVMISVNPVSTSAYYSVYATAGLYVSGNAPYTDPHAGEYYVEYYENGVYHSLKGSYITSWQFLSTGIYPTPVQGGCSYPSYDSYGSGPSQALVAFVADPPFVLQFNRQNLTSVPLVGEYGLSPYTYNSSQNKNTGNCNLIINGATFNCSGGTAGADQSFVYATISEVKIDQDLGVEKRGYYVGAFDAILYYTPSNGGALQERVITGGRFMAPLGSNLTTPIINDAPAIDRFKLLTTGKWYFRPTIEAELKDPNSEASTCNLDDYMIFNTNNSTSWVDGGVQCAKDEGDIDYGTAQWSLINNQTTIRLISNTGEISDLRIFEISDSIMNLEGLKLSHGN